jgi:cytochrome c-type biogenesis protein CcmH
MSGFLMAATLLLALALFFILPPLLDKRPATRLSAGRDDVNLAVLRDQLRELDSDLAQGIIDAAAYQSARHELEQRVAQDVAGADAQVGGASAALRWQAIAMTLALFGLAAGLYSYLGTPAGLDPALTRPAAAPADAKQMSAEQINAMVEQLATRLQGDAGDVKGWTMLARSYAGLGRFGDANRAYAHLLELAPNDASVLTDAADALAMSQNQSLQGAPEKLLQRALAQNPKEVKALILMGSLNYERRDYAAAVANWQKMAALLPPESELARLAADNIKEAQAMLAGKGAAPALPVAAAGASAGAVAGAAVTAAGVEGTVELDPAMKAQAAPDDTVFIFARAPEGGPRFPLAVLRKQVKDLPLHFTLDDSLSMMPDVKLSGFPQVMVGARISKSGNAIPAPGDLEGTLQQVAPGTKGIKLVINARRP